MKSKGWKNLLIATHMNLISHRCEGERPQNWNPTAPKVHQNIPKFVPDSPP